MSKTNGPAGTIQRSSAHSRLLLSVPLGLLALLIAVMAAPGNAQVADPPGNLNLINLKTEAGHQQVTLDMGRRL